MGRVIARHQDWPARLAAFIASRQDVAFVWGATDCALFAADWVAEATGVDHGKRYRGKYKTARGAAGALRRRGAGTLPDTVTGALGPPLGSPTLAQRGDVVALLIEDGVPSVEDMPALGICLGTQAAYLAPGTGLRLVPMDRCHQAWRV